jgi:hypothetical protein
MVIEEWPSISLDVLQVGAGRVGEGRRAVAEVVEPDRREAGLLVQLDEAPCDVGGVKHLAVLLGEDATGLRPGTPPFLTILVLLGAVPLGGLDRVGVERDGARAGVGLGVVLVHLPAVHDELLGDGDETGIEVGVGPLLPARPAPAQLSRAVSG